MNRVENVLKYYELTHCLKDVIRSGWKRWNVKRERLESVAEHVYGVQQLAIAMYSEYQYDIDLYKVLAMLSVHELEETIIGDLTPYDCSASEKLEKGHKAIEEALSCLIEKEKIKSLILEFDERKTKEAKFAHYCDKLECVIQCKLYDRENCVDLNQQASNSAMELEETKRLLETESSWSNMWVEIDRPKFEGEENFLEVLDYLKEE